MNLRRMHAVARKEFYHVVRDHRSLSMALAMPLLMLLLFGYALTLDVDQIPTLIYDADLSPQSRELIEKFNGSRYFNIMGKVNDYQTIERQVDTSECLLGLVIPADFSDKLLAGQEADIQVLLDGSDSNTASIALGYVSGVLLTHNQRVRNDAMNSRMGRRIDPPAEARIRVWYNNEMKSRNYIVPGLIAVILMIIAALLTSLTVAREWENGTMEQLLSTPLRPAEIVFGKMLAYFGVGVIDTSLAIGIGVLIFGVPLRGSIILLAFSCFIFLMGALFWGIFLSAATRSQLLAYQMGMVTSFLPAFLLSGFIYAIEAMPLPIQIFTYIVPARYFITILQGIFLKGVGLKILAVEIVLLIVYAAIIFMAATSKLRQKVA